MTKRKPVNKSKEAQTERTLNTTLNSLSGAEIENENRKNRISKAVASFTSVAFTLLVLLVPVTLLLIGGLLTSVALRFLEVFGMKVYSFGYRFFWHELLFYRKGTPPVFPKKISKEIH